MFNDLSQHGNTQWKYPLLLRTSLCWLISERRSWRRRYQQIARGWLDEIDNGNGKALTFEGFLKAVQRDYEVMVQRMVKRLRQVMFQVDPQLRQIAGRDVFAVDGTSLELPRTRENQEFFCGADVDIDNDESGESRWKLTPQMHLTTLWHVRLALPWEWKTGPGDTGERNDMRDMVGSLPENAVVVGDAGFVGYDLWDAIRAKGVDIVVRLGSNVHLIEGLEPNVGDRKDLFSYWPHEARRAKQSPRLLRLVKTVLGETETYLVTSVLDPNQLSDSDVVEIYKSRWGVEVFYRGLKQTFNRRKLLGRTPASALAELHLSMISLWMLHLIGLLDSPEIRADKASLPALSTVRLLDAFRDALNHPNEISPACESLHDRITRARLDEYERKRDKQSRHYPRKNQQKKCGLPEIRQPLREEKTKLATLIKTGVYLANAI